MANQKTMKKLCSNKKPYFIKLKVLLPVTWYSHIFNRFVDHKVSCNKTLVSKQKCLCSRKSSCVNARVLLLPVEGGGGGYPSAVRTRAVKSHIQRAHQPSDYMDTDVNIRVIGVMWHPFPPFLRNSINWTLRYWFLNCLCRTFIVPLCWYAIRNVYWIKLDRLERGNPEVWIPIIGENFCYHTHGDDPS